MNEKSATEREGQGGGVGTGGCGRIRDLLPLALNGTLLFGERAEVEAHLAGCQECRSEELFLRRVLAARPRAPGSLVLSVMEALDGTTPGRMGRGSLTWGLRAAAVAVLALGVGVLWQWTETPDPMWSLALDAPAESWGQEDWMVAGSALLDGVSEETLLALFEEMYP
jgi:anti-sigma factor RsiW